LRSCCRTARPERHHPALRSRPVRGAACWKTPIEDSRLDDGWTTVVRGVRLESKVLLLRPMGVRTRPTHPRLPRRGRPQMPSVEQECELVGGGPLPVTSPSVPASALTQALSHANGDLVRGDPLGANRLEHAFGSGPGDVRQVRHHVVRKRRADDLMVAHPLDPFYTSIAAGPCERYAAVLASGTTLGVTHDLCPARPGRGVRWEVPGSPSDRAVPRPCPLGGSSRRPAACRHRREHGPAGGAGGDACCDVAPDLGALAQLPAAREVGPGARPVQGWRGAVR